MFSGFRMERMSDGFTDPGTNTGFRHVQGMRIMSRTARVRGSDDRGRGGRCSWFKVKSIMTRTDSISRQVDLILQESIRRRIDRFSFV